jgi:mediator of RNA polymerase II transcription subunit 13
LDLTPSIPLPSGAPIILLPYGTPAYFLANYNGPVSGIVKQFRESLRGLGIGDWEGHCVSSKDSHRPAHGLSVNNFGQAPTFIIGWIKVENKQGEDKGITIIYPSSLCLSYVPSSCPRPLDYIPELPTPLQPSPQVPPAAPSIFSSLSPSDTGESSSFYSARLPIPVSPTCDSLRSFRTLTLSKSKDIRQVATEIGGYVDAVARDRERERERLRREREVGTSSSPKISRTVTSTSTSVSMPVEMDITHPAAPTVLQANASEHSAYPPAQNFYPSPPQTNPTIVPSSDSRTSPVAKTKALLPTEISTSVQPPFIEPVPTSAVSGTYDPFGNIDGAWSKPGASYLDADIDMDFGMDLDMGFNMNMNSMSGGGRSGAYNDRDGMDFEDAFTDDDFSFFDRPSRPSAAAPPSAPSSTNLSRSHHSPENIGPSLPVPASQMLLGNSTFSPIHGDVSKPPQYTPAPHSSVWTPGVSIEELTHPQHDHPDSKLPELLPSSLAQTPESHSAPPTPNVVLDFDPVIRRPTTSTGYSSPFEPIPFAQHHRAADHKYAQGKFALSSSNEDDRAESLFHYLPSSPNGFNGWRLRYDAVTDPRIGVVRKLIGVKRKTPFGHTGRRSGKLPPWIRSHEDWELPNDEEGVDDQSELESEDEDFGDNESPLVSRPATPPPAYLPLGPSLLHTQFHHSGLLPLSMPLRPPGAAVAPTNLTASALLPSVPTPVSPAATMGAASEKSKSLEAAAFAIAAEVVENPLWAETWRANTGPKDASDVWAADVRAVAELLEDVPDLEGLTDVASLFGLGELPSLSNTALKSPTNCGIRAIQHPSPYFPTTRGSYDHRWERRSSDSYSAACPPLLGKAWPWSERGAKRHLGLCSFRRWWRTT